MYAVIETGGKQYRVEVGTELEVELLDVEPGQSITLERVLLVADGAEARLARPWSTVRPSRPRSCAAIAARRSSPSSTARRRADASRRVIARSCSSCGSPTSGSGARARPRPRARRASRRSPSASASRRRRTAGRGGRGPRREAPGRRREGRGGREAGEDNDEEACREGRRRRGAGQGGVEGKDDHDEGGGEARSQACREGDNGQGGRSEGFQGCAGQGRRRHRREAQGDAHEEGRISDGPQESRLERQERPRQRRPAPRRQGRRRPARPLGDDHRPPARHDVASGEGTGLGRDYTVFATVDGKVRFEHATRNKKRVRVIPVAAEPAAAEA